MKTNKYLIRLVLFIFLTSFLVACSNKKYMSHKDMGYPKFKKIDDKAENTRE